MGGIQTDQQMLDDNRPVAQRRKRRASSGLCNPQGESLHPSDGVAQTRSCDAPKTPMKPKKRVRFSDPGPESSLNSASTGITPFVQRTTLEPRCGSPPPTPRLLARPPRRRASMPVISSEASDTDYRASASIEIQFAPLRQVLSERSKRRLRRNHLSEESNAIQEERKAARSREEEIRSLREELARVRQEDEFEHAQGRAAGDVERVRELEDEIVTLKTEIGSRSGTEEPCLATPSADDAVSLIAVDDAGRDDAHPVAIDTPPETPTASVPLLTTQSTTQTDVTGRAAESLESHITTQTTHLVAARLELERLCPGETALGLTPAAGDAAPVLAALLDRLRHTRSALDGATTALAAARTHETNTRGHFDRALQQLDAARKINADHESAATKQEARVRELEREAEGRETRNARLAGAFDKYRAEVASLERLVTRVERQGKDAVARVRAQRDEAVADLECVVAAETRGRREAEEEVAQRAMRVRELEERERELLGVVYEKQGIVRMLEGEVQKGRKEREDEVGRLNVKVAELSERLAEVKAELERSEAEREVLIGKVELEMREGERMRGDLKGLVEGWETRGAGEGEAVTQRNLVGLLTPRIEGGRFTAAAAEPVDGKIEMKRGKSRRSRKVDSGIGILEEDVQAENEGE